MIVAISAVYNIVYYLMMLFFIMAIFVEDVIERNKYFKRVMELMCMEGMLTIFYCYYDFSIWRLINGLALIGIGIFGLKKFVDTS